MQIRESTSDPPLRVFKVSSSRESHNTGTTDDDGAISGLLITDSSMDASALQRRVVIHLDLDCFYAQVEAKRLGIDGSVPLAVQQWSGLIAVNYPARHKGVKRHLNVVEAKKLVPELVCVHVETIGDDEGGADGADTAGEGDAMGEKPTEKTDGTSHDKERRKVSLRRYRRASWRVMAALADQCEHVERASIDEAYVDVTREVDAAMDQKAQIQTSPSKRWSSRSRFVRGGG